MILSDFAIALAREVMFSHFLDQVNPACLFLRCMSLSAYLDRFSNLQDRGANAGTSEMSTGRLGPPATYLRWTASLFFPPQFLSLFSLPPASFSFCLCPSARSPRQGGCRRCWLPSLPLSWPVARRALRQAAAACDRAQTLGRWI